MLLSQLDQVSIICCDSCGKTRKRKLFLDKTFAKCNDCTRPPHVCSALCKSISQQCHVCQGVFPLEKFKVDRYHKNGHLNKCLQCFNDVCKQTRRRYKKLNENHDCVVNKCAETLKYCNYHKCDHLRSEFFLNKNSKDSHHHHCKNADRGYTIKKLYGITREQFDEELKRFNFCCHLCKKPLEGDIVVDHCHTKNAYRGILHRKCNFLLGQADDDKELLLAGAKYLELFSS